ncbi:hypothetical protein ES705_00702 [subsurface metagenome]|nr:hypothetical protein [Clostridia bacterium]
MLEIIYNSDNKDSILKSLGPYMIMDSDNSFKGLYFTNDKFYLEKEKYKDIDIKLDIKKSYTI